MHESDPKLGRTKGLAIAFLTYIEKLGHTPSSIADLKHDDVGMLGVPPTPGFGLNLQLTLKPRTFECSLLCFC